MSPPYQNTLWRVTFQKCSSFGGCLLKAKSGGFGDHSNRYLSCKSRLSTKVAIEASDFGGGGHTLGGISQFAHGYFSEWESIQSSTFRGLLGVIRCLQSLIEICKNNLVEVQADAMNLLGIEKRGSPRLAFEYLGTQNVFSFASHTKLIF